MKGIEEYWKTVRENIKDIGGLSIVKPKLSVDDLDSLLWFTDAFNADWDLEETSLESREFHKTLGCLHPQAQRDMETAHDYVEKLIMYNLAQGGLSLKMKDLTIKEVSFDKPIFYGVEQYVEWHKKLPTREPRLTRKRANGLWWLLTFADEMEATAEHLGIGEVYRVLVDGEPGKWDRGKAVIAGLARYHESRFPTAPRGAA